MSDLLDFLRVHEEAFHFRLQRTSNPDGYQANSSAWLRALTAAARAGLLPATRNSASPQASHLAFSSGDELARSLQTQQWGRPLALDAVIRDAVEKRELIPLNDFLNAKNSVYSKSWIPPSPWQVVSWGLKQIGASGLLGGEDRLAVGNFVVLANVEAAADAIIKQASQDSLSLTSRIYSRELFESSFAHILNPSSPSDALSSTDFSILLAYMSRDKAYLSHSSTTVKFRAPGEPQPSPITQQDADIASLRTLMTTLNAQVDSLTARVSALDRAVRHAIAAKQSPQAKSALRSKKLAEATLQARVATLAQLDDVYASIETAADQVAVVRVMEASGSVLRSLHRQVGGVEGVEGVVDRLREEMENVDEVGRVINEPNAGKIDEDEVEEELELLQRAEREKREEAERAEREKREEVERAEREKKEAEEAEATATRLKELDTLDEESKAAEREAQTKDKEAQDKVMADIGESI
ncbi:hypothetical protein MBLNU459_g1855t1 [Dothideomycetes sp. NU459]